MEAVDLELDRLISKPASQDPDDREELYMESVRRYDAQRREEMKAAWCEYHRGQADRLRRTMEPLIAFHEGRAAELLNLEPEQFDTPGWQNGVSAGGHVGLGASADSREWPGEGGA